MCRADAIERVRWRIDELFQRIVALIQHRAIQTHVAAPHRVPLLPGARLSHCSLAFTQSGLRGRAGLPPSRLSRGRGHASVAVHHVGRGIRAMPVGPSTLERRQWIP